VWGLLQGAKRDERMNEIMLGATLMGNMGMMVAYWMMIKEMRRDLLKIIQKVDEGIDNIEIDIPDIDDLKQEIVEIMGSMRTPGAADHIFGAIAQMIQAKTMRGIQQSELIPEEMLHNDEPTSP